jgi:integrase
MMAGGTRRANGEGSISKRKDGRWEGRYSVETPLGTKRRTVYGKTRREVVKKMAGAPREESLRMDPKVTLKDYLKRWLEDSVKDSVRPTTYHRYESIVRLHVDPILGGTRLLKLTPAKIQALYRERLDSGCSPRTVRYLHVTLHKALDQALKWQLVPANVTEAVTAPRVTREEITPLSPAQVKVFLRAVEGERLEPMFVLAVTTGMRQGELLGLKWEDVDLDEGVVRVRRTLSRDGRKIIFSPPKTAKGKRTIGLTGPSVECLRRHRALQEAERPSWSEDLGLVFPNAEGRPRSSRGYLTEALRDVLKKNGLPEIRFHDLRHTCATLLLSKNVHAKLVQEMLGHATISITLDTYSHVLPSMRSEAVSAMEDLLD